MLSNKSNNHNVETGQEPVSCDARSIFKLIKRGYKDTIVLIPGWATDYRIFDSLDIEYNYILPTEYYPASFVQELLEFLDENKIDKISILGLSMGGYVAQDFFKEYGSRVHKVTLVGMRQGYDEKEVKKVRFFLLRNYKLYLEKFYESCFRGADKEFFELFKNSLLNYYLDGLELDRLLEDLDYLESVSLDSDVCNNNKFCFVHSAIDEIAPLDTIKHFFEKILEAKINIQKNIPHIFIPTF